MWNGLLIFNSILKNSIQKQELGSFIHVKFNKNDYLK